MRLAQASRSSSSAAPRHLANSTHAAAAPRLMPAARRSVKAAFVQQDYSRVSVDALHRTERLIGLAHEFIDHWVAGAKDGPTEEILQRLGTVTDSQVTIKTAHLLGKTEFTGLGGLRDKLTLDRFREGSMRPVRAVMCAANEDDDSVFCLLECHGDPSEVEMGTGVEKMKHKTRGLVKFDTLLDDTACRVTGLTERWQLGPTDAALLALHAPHAGQEEYKGGALRAAMQVARSSHFPSGHIRKVSAQEFDSRAALHSMEMWCAARCSGADEAKLLDQALVKHDYCCWDAYGVLPLVCGIKEEVGGVPHSCVMYAGQVVDMLRRNKAQNRVTCTLMDKAVSPDHNVGFVHWVTFLHSQSGEGAKEGPAWVYEALEMHVFDDDGRIRETWMLRDPTKAEEEMLESVARAPVAKTGNMHWDA